MVKPSMPYLDVIADAARLTPDHPIACYQVSGEFAMIHAGAQAGVYDLKTMAFESVDGMVRAGASLNCVLLIPNLTYPSRCYIDPDLLYSGVLGMVVTNLYLRVKTVYDFAEICSIHSQVNSSCILNRDLISSC